MVRTLEKFSSIHLITESLNKVGLYRDILQYYGHDCSLPFVYGISNLFGFTFYYGITENTNLVSEKSGFILPDFKTPSFFASGDYFLGLNNALRATNVWCQRGSKNNRKAFFDLLKTYINEGRPVHLVVDQYKWFKNSDLINQINPELMPDFRWKQNNVIENNIRLGDYHILCVGYDDTDYSLKILDYYSSNILEIAFDMLYECTNIHDSYLAPANKWFVYYVPPELPDKKTMVISALKYTLNASLKPFKSTGPFYFGLYGLEKFTREMKNILKTDLSENSITHMHHMLASSSSVGMMHDFNRLIFSDFLIEASVLLRNSELEKSGTAYKSIAVNWSKFFRVLNNDILMDKKRMTDDGFELLDMLYEKEKEALQMLNNSISKI